MSSRETRDDRIAPPDAELADLVVRVTRRDPEAFAGLYDRYVDSIYRYLHFRVRNPTEAEDLTEQVFLRAWQAIESYRPTGRPFSSWLYSIARNLVIDHFRSARPSAGLPEDALAPASFAEPAVVLDQTLAMDRFREALQELTPDQQQVIILRFIEGLGYEDVAQAIGKSPGTVRVIQHRALAKLRQFIEEGS
ncbi:MAG TPA: sigma-70 family RNA polymerase sigma factor [Dehalococcoidia bacterium]|nr:sigma-70 family RNA polymerase sigma factor [Dehalococcoidia bacterium]